LLKSKNYIREEIVRHCEEAVFATKQSRRLMMRICSFLHYPKRLDCVASLAMTWRGVTMTEEGLQFYTYIIARSGFCDDAIQVLVDADL
jgi:hypothetical protein